MFSKLFAFAIGFLVMASFIWLVAKVVKTRRFNRKMAQQAEIMLRKRKCRRRELNPYEVALIGF